jgi:hypothetical protein
MLANWVYLVDFLVIDFTGYYFLAFLAAGFLAAGFLAAGFLAAGFLATGFLATGFLAAGFVTTGVGLTTGAAAIVRVRAAVPGPSSFVADIEIPTRPAVVGVPLMTPVVELIVRPDAPDGNVAENVVGLLLAVI